MTTTMKSKPTLGLQYTPNMATQHVLTFSEESVIDDVSVHTGRLGVRRDNLG